MDKDTFLYHLNKKLLEPCCVNLAVGQPDFKPHPDIIRAFKDHVNRNTGYTPVQGIPVLQDEIKRKLRRENKVDAEEVIVTTGAIESIFDSMITYLKKNDEVILFSPAYHKYRLIAEILGVKIREIDMRNGRPNINDLEKSITDRTRMIIINSPNNPTGIVFSKDEIQQIVQVTEKNNLILVSDEVYETYVYEQSEHISPAQFSNQVLTVNSFSKTYGFPGLRIGYVAGSDHLINPIIKTHMSNTTCSSFAAQMAAVTALQLPSIPFSIESFNKRRLRMINRLGEMGLNFLYPKGAFYVYVSINGDAIEVAFRLLKKNLLCMPSLLYEQSNDAIRLSYASDIEYIERGMEIFRKYV